MQRITSLPIRNFLGPNVRVNSTDNPVGTMQIAEGVNTVPQGALSFGPKWLTAWSKSQLGDNITTALSGADTAKVHFVTIALGSTKFLIAWDLAANRSRGIWHVGGTGEPNFTSTQTAAILAPNDSIYRNHAAGLNWYGSWIQNELWLGNGSDANLVWSAGALSVLGPTTRPVNPQDPSQFPFPPCLSFIEGPQGQVYGTGYENFPKRVWATQIPNVTFPLVRGLKTENYSWVSIQNNAERITALGNMGVDIIAHFEIGPPSIISGYNGDAGGWKLSELSTEANAGAINPNCARDTKIATSYFGTDLQLYRLETYKGSIVDRQTGGSKWRKTDILTDAGGDVWNDSMAKPADGDDYGIIFDQKNGRTWIWSKLALGTILDRTPAVFYGGLDTPWGMATNDTDGVAFSDYNSGLVYVGEDSPGMDIPTVPADFANPTGVAFDSAGNLYVAASGEGGFFGPSIYKIVGGFTVTRYSFGYDTPWGLAFDSANNLYVSDYNTGFIFKVPTSGSRTLLPFSFSNPAGLAVDGSDNLYVANYGNGNIDKITSAGVKTTIASGFDTPIGLALDTSGNLYVTSQNGGTVSRINLTNGNVSDTGLTLGNPTGIAFGGTNGALYVAEYGNNDIVKIDVSGSQGLFCYDDRTRAITGPWRYPDFLSFCQLRDENLNGCLVCGITREGAFLWSDLQNIGDFKPPAYLTALPHECAELSFPPTPNPGIPYVGVSADGQSFMEVLEGNAINLATPWSDWAEGGLTCTRFYQNARLAVVEFAECDCNSQALQKQFENLRLTLNRNSIIYYGVYVEVDGRQTGGWRGLAWPSIDWIAAIGGEGSTIKIRLLICSFNAQPGVLSGLTLDYQPAVLN